MSCMKGGFYVSKVHALIIIIIFVLICVGIGLLAGLIKPSCPDYVFEDPTDAPETTPVPTESGPWLDPMLPEYFKPVLYTMWMYPDFYFDGNMFYGKEDVEIDVLQDTHYVLIQIKYIDITDTKLTKNQQELNIVRTFEYVENQYWVIETQEVIEAGSRVTLHLEFQGSLVNGIVGYYKSNYTNSITGERSWLATTKFQPSDSRKAFPNFDEPKFKANFSVTLKHWKNFTALSNMPSKENRTLDADFMETEFLTTPVMSSYLVAFIVCDFKFKENNLSHGIPHRLWASPDKIDQVDYALDTGMKIADYFAELFDLYFPLPKLDEFAVPDYPSGATEHWGLVTYRESRLLYDPAVDSDSDMQGVAGIISHEHAHHYFGNAITCRYWDEIWLHEAFAMHLMFETVDKFFPDVWMYFGNSITCHWWDEIWLNEAPAAFFEDNGTDHVHPEFDATGQFVVVTQQPVMETDAGTSSRPIVIPVNNPDEATAAFDSITYDKGASVLRMMQDFMGHDKFLNGMRKLIHDFEYTTITTNDLWDAMQAQVGDELNIAETMDPWVLQMGLPVVDITELSGGATLKATQERFMNDPDADPSEPESPYEYKWDIPLTYITKSDRSKQRLWITGDSIEFSNPATTEWIKFNADQTGFYRVNMPDHMWTDLKDQLVTDHQEFTEIDRASILDDALNLARAIHLDYNIALDMTVYLEEELHYFPWRSARGSLNYIRDMFHGHADYDLWRAYIRQITDNAMNELTTEDGGTHLDKLNRNNIINLACTHGNQECLQNTTITFVDYVQNISNAVPLNTKRVIYSYGMQQTGGEHEFNILWERYQDPATSANEADNLIYALAQTTNVWLVHRFLEYAMNETLIRSQDFHTVMGYISDNPEANPYVWDYTRAHYDEMVYRFGTGDRYFGRVVPRIVEDYNTESKLKEVEEFYAKYPDAGAGERPREQSIDSIKNNIDWMERNEKLVIDWLKDNVREVATTAKTSFIR